MLPPEVARAIADWRPRLFSDDVAAFSRLVVEAVGPESKQRAKALLFASAKLASFAEKIGAELDKDTVLSFSFIERYCSTATLSAPTRRTLRTNLRHIAAHQPGCRPGGARMSREHAKAPYSQTEIASYLALCDAQPTTLRRFRANGLICLGAGAGLIGGELRSVRGTDVVCRSGGVLVVVRAKTPRVVPVLGDFHERLLASAAYFSGDYLVSGRNPDSHNVTNPLLRSLSGGRDLPRLQTCRLRSTYLVAMAEQIGLKAFMDAAGITCSQRLGDLVAHLEPPSEEEAVALLGGWG